MLAKEGYDVIATNVTIGESIQNLGCDTQQHDVSCPPSIEAFKRKLGDRPVELLLNVAWVMQRHANDMLESITLATLQNTFAVNTFGPLLLTQALLPNIVASISPTGTTPKIVVMSSRMGSISDNGFGGQYAYRSSKAAVNAIFKSIAVDLLDRKVAVILLHPGIVRTNMTEQLGVFETSQGVEPAEAAEELWGLLSSKTLAESEKWWHRSGEELPS